MWRHIEYELHSSACRQWGRERAGNSDWVPTHPSSPWRVSPSVSSADPSTISACPGPTGGTAWWKWKPVASTPSPRRNVFVPYHSPSQTNVNQGLYVLMQICAVESSSATERSLQLPYTTGFRVRLLYLTTYCLGLTTSLLNLTILRSYPPSENTYCTIPIEVIHGNSLVAQWEYSGSTPSPSKPQCIG